MVLVSLGNHLVPLYLCCCEIGNSTFSSYLNVPEKVQSQGEHPSNRCRGGTLETNHNCIPVEAVKGQSGGQNTDHCFDKNTSWFFRSYHDLRSCWSLQSSLQLLKRYLYTFTVQHEMEPVIYYRVHRNTRAELWKMAVNS